MGNYHRLILRASHSLSKAGIEVTGLTPGIQEAKAMKTPGWEWLRAGKWSARAVLEDGGRPEAGNSEMILQKKTR